MAVDPSQTYTTTSFANPQIGTSMDPTSLYNLWNYYQQLAQQQYQWGQQQYASNSALTDQVVNDYLSKASTLTGMGTSDLARYQGIFQPLENQLVANAKSFAGAPRVAAEMGRAGATAAQTAEQGRQNAIADLESKGLDPSAGRYADLSNAERMQQAASVTGAQNTAREQTEATGRGLMSEAVQVGERYPGQIANELSTALTADTGAINAKLANANTGVNLMGSPTQWAQLSNTAVQNRRYPQAPGGTQVNWPNQQKQQGGGQGGGGSGGGSGGGVNPYQLMGGSYPGSGPGSQTSSYGGGTGGGGGGGGSDPFSGTDFQGNFDPTGSSYGYSGDGSTSDLSGSGWDTSGTTSSDTFGTYSDQGGGGDLTSDNAMQAGGAIDDGSMPPQPSPMGPTTGGQVGMQASPSAGAIPDDVPARLSAHEYVIPRDVALWKGREHFQRLIDKARQDMSGATAKPSMKPALNQRPTFRSRPMGPAIPGAM